LNRSSGGGSRNLVTVTEIRWEDNEDGRLIRLEGELDHVGCAQIANNFRTAATEAEKNVVVDLGGVRFVASHGLRMLIQLHKLLKAEGRALRVRGLCPQVRRVFETTGLFQAMPELEG